MFSAICTLKGKKVFSVPLSEQQGSPSKIIKIVSTANFSSIYVDAHEMSRTLACLFSALRFCKIRISTSLCLEFSFSSLMFPNKI